MAKIAYQLNDNDEKVYLSFSIDNDKSCYNYEYDKSELRELLKTMGKDNFMNYQLKYISENFKTVDLKEQLMLIRAKIRKEIINLL